jgi:hypothetical protein
MVSREKKYWHLQSGEKVVWACSRHSQTFVSRAFSQCSLGIAGFLGIHDSHHTRGSSGSGAGRSKCTKIHGLVLKGFSPVVTPTYRRGLNTTPRLINEEVIIRDWPDTLSIIWNCIHMANQGSLDGETVDNFRDVLTRIMDAMIPTSK